MKLKIHPLDQAKFKNKPYVYWHVHEVHEKMIKEAIKRHSSIEWDISYDEDTGKPFIGHPKVFYTIEKKIPLPDNIDLWEAVEMVKNADDLLIILDCKDKRALPTIKKIINTLGLNRCLMHSFIKEWGYPYPPEVHMEAHWPVEDIPLEAIKLFKEQTGIKCIGAMHAISEARLKKESLVDKAITMASGIFESISIYLPGVPIPPLEEIKKIVSAGYFPWLNYDLLFEKNDFDFPYIGMTDFPERSTVTPDLYK